MSDTSAGPQQALVLVTADLFLGSRIRATAEQSGLAVVTAPTFDRAMAILADQTPNRVLIDLTIPRLDFATLAERIRDFPNGTVAAYAPHVRVDLLKAARAAGVQTALTRSQLEVVLPRWFET